MQDPTTEQTTPNLGILTEELLKEVSSLETNVFGDRPMPEEKTVALVGNQSKIDILVRRITEVTIRISSCNAQLKKLGQ